MPIARIPLDRSLDLRVEREPMSEAHLQCPTPSQLFDRHLQWSRIARVSVDDQELLKAAGADPRRQLDDDIREQPGRK